MQENVQADSSSVNKKNVTRYNFLVTDCMRAGRHASFALMQLALRVAWC
jgi:hypothetical protein